MHKGTSEAPVLSESERERRSKGISLRGESKRKPVSYTHLLKLDSNPEFTGSVLVAYARAAYRLSKNGEAGARSVFDIAPAMLSQMTPEELRSHLL